MRSVVARGLIAWCVMSCVSYPSDALGGSPEYEHQLQGVPHGPIQLGHVKGVSWAEYCPDETCELVRTRRPIEREALGWLALSYFYYVSEYSYLQSWRENELRKAQVDSFLMKWTSEQCPAVAGRARSICALRSLAEIYQLEILVIRHDEKKTRVQKLPRDEHIK